MRAHAMTAVPSAAVHAARARCSSSSSVGESETSASVGQTVVHAPHPTHSPGSTAILLYPSETAPAMHASTHSRHVDLRCRTAAHRCGTTSTCSVCSDSAISMMSDSFGIGPPLPSSAYARSESSSACSSTGVFALMKQPPMGSAAST